MTTERTVRNPGRRGGQALVEFSLALIPFLLILMGIVDLGRGVYMSSGVNEAAREIARATAVHPYKTGTCTLGNSDETAAVVNTQKGLIPGLSDPAASITYACTSISDATAVPKAGFACMSGDFVKVTVSVPYTALTPVLSMVAPSTLVSTAHIQVP